MLTRYFIGSVGWYGRPGHHLPNSFDQSIRRLPLIGNVTRLEYSVAGDLIQKSQRLSNIALTTGTLGGSSGFADEVPGELT